MLQTQYQCISLYKHYLSVLMHLMIFRAAAPNIIIRGGLPYSFGAFTPRVIIAPAFLFLWTGLVSID